MSSADTNGAIGGRRANGRFALGNKGGPGNPHVRKLASLRLATSAAVSPEDMMEILAKMVEKAKAGDSVAATFVFDRTIGKPVQGDLEAKIDELESILAEYLRQLDEHRDDNRLRIATTPEAV